MRSLPHTDGEIASMPNVFHGFGWAAPPCGPASCFSSSIEEER